MDSLDKALQTQIDNLQTRAGKTLEQLFNIIHESGLSKHGQIRDTLKKDLGMGHGDANTLAHLYLKSLEDDGETSEKPSLEALIDIIYSGPKADLRPIYDKLMAAIEAFGDFEIAPKKGDVSLRRKKQFAMITPATKTRVEVGLNMKGVDATQRLIELPKGRMCQYKVDMTGVDEVDGTLIAWIKQAYDTSG